MGSGIELPETISGLGSELINEGKNVSLWLKDSNGDKIVVEIKPYNQTQKPLNENCWAAKEYVKNKCKWGTAMEFCKTKGYKFHILTEKTINSL